MEFEIILAGKVSQTQEDNGCLCFLICGIKTKDQNGTKGEGGLLGERRGQEEGRGRRRAVVRMYKIHRVHGRKCQANYCVHRMKESVHT